LTIFNFLELCARIEHFEEESRGSVAILKDFLFRTISNKAKINYIGILVAIML
jgi:hypothetical protein